ncbi:S9 family peptidase [Thalassotalea fusca]
MNNTKLSTWFALASISLAIAGCQTTTMSASTPAKEAQSSTQSLTLERIYKDHEFSSDYIGRIRWLEDGSGYTAVESSAAKKQNDEGKEVSIGKDIVLYNPETLAREVLISASQLTPEGAEAPLKINNYIWSADRSKLLIYTNSKRVWRSNSRGDYWVLDIAKNTLKQLGGKNAEPSALMFAKFSPNGENVAYVTGNEIFVESLTTGNIKQLTNDAQDGRINGLFDWVYEEEFTIRDGFRWSPDGQKIAYWQLDTSGSKDFIMINNTDELYPTITKFPYPKVGETNALAKIGIVDVSSTKTVWANLPNNSRNMYIPRMNWSGNSEQVLIQHVNRKQDTNHLYLTNASNGNFTKIMTEEEEHFLDFYDDARWLDNGNSFIWTSERSGWRHLYRISRDGKEVLNLTNGDFDVVSIQAIDEDNGWLYFIASPDNVAQRYLYRSKLDASVVNQRVTPKAFAGSNSYQMSDNGEWAIHTHSTFEQPAQKRLIKVDGHQEKHLMMDNQKLINQLSKLNRPSTEFFQVKAQDGVVLDGYLMKPANFDKTKKYPIIFYVYGEPWGQTVQDRWRGSSYLWDQMMTEQGFIIASIDNRGTRAPKGRDWRKSIYGEVGVKSSRDQSDALKEMAKRWSFIDTDRVGIWGHSGGGSMTLNMLFRYPEQYHVGISLAPVPDQRLYDTIYQERYSGLLPDYEEGYKQGSPITHAKNLQGKLLLVHGTGDDNVHYQGAERLINELVKHNRQFDFMSYPNRSHGIYEGPGTTLHLKTMMADYFIEHLKNKK